MAIFSTPRDEEGPRYSLVESREYRSIRLSKLHKMAIRRLLCRLNPARDVRDIMVVGDKRKLECARLLELKQQCACLREANTVRLCVRKNAEKSQLCDGTGS